MKIEKVVVDEFPHDCSGCPFRADHEIYKKALKMACKTLSWEGTDEVVNKYIDYHLKKAGTE